LGDVYKRQIHFGSFLYVDMQQTSIHDCTFRSSCDAGTADPIGILIVSGPVVAIRNNRFLDEGSVPLATRLRLQGPGPSEQVRLEGNLFHHAMGADSAAAPVVELNYTVGDVQVRGNTFVRCGFDSRSGGLVFENNIVARGNVVLAQQGPGDAACNDIWKGALENGIPGFEVRDNISADPMFCSEPSGDFRIAYESPCEAANTGGCGTIGALGASCNVVRTKSLSWGAMRWSFRAEKP
ncbi:MAG: hypothetical protein QUU85_06570, partial [Candidatus Eisenbacteria bacterium]|nr:hypothetical protein [Candidatus Eisenbacteria bacterium]